MAKRLSLGEPTKPMCADKNLFDDDDEVTPSLAPTYPNVDQPLAAKARPRLFAHLSGQEAIWSVNSTLWKLAEADQFHSLIFWGPPGTGKTSLASMIGDHASRPLVTLSAVSTGVKEIRATIDASAERIRRGEKAVLVFMDEVHRLNKAQQDVLLPALEEGFIKFIGATTENPSFEVNSAILSRSLVFRFDRLSTDSLKQILMRALKGPLAELNKTISDEALDLLASNGNGDARQSLNLLEAICHSCPADHIDLDEMKAFGGQILRYYDKAADQHYDTISAFIKCIRASKADAAVYYLARMLDSGEDPMFIARRLVIAASEDIGMANPQALSVAASGLAATHAVGMPEARIILAEVTVYLAESEKSNRSYMMIQKAQALVEKYGNLEIPHHLRNAPTQFMKEIGYGKGYVYAHDDKEGANKMNYFPDELLSKKATPTIPK